MSKEDDLERFCLEYSLFDVEDVSSIDEVKGYIEVFLDDLDDYNISFDKEIKRNKLEKIRAKLSNYFDVIIGYEFPDYYDEDSKVVGEEIKLVKSFKKVVDKLFGKINDSNYSDIYKLIKFVRNKFFVYQSYLERKRDGVELSYNGIYMNVPVSFDINSFFDFINSEIKRISLNNSVEKKKVM